MRLLLVAEAPPSALDRYFYFEDVRDQDSLFRYVVQTLLEVQPTRDGKVALLSALCDHGVFLIDLKTDPKLVGETLDRYVDDLVTRATALTPQHVITIKANVCDLCQSPLRSAGLHVVDQPVPFPGSGQQLRFVDAMRRALKSIGWR